MAEDALGPGVDAITPLATPAGCGRVVDRDRPGRPPGIGEDRVGLVVVPDVGIRTPGAVQEVEDLGLDPTAGRRFPVGSPDGDRPDQDGAFGEAPVALLVETDAAVAGDRQEPLGRWRRRPRARN